MMSGQLVPIRRDLDLAFDAWLGPASRSRMIAEAAREIVADAQAVNQAALGIAVAVATYVDARRSAQLEQVRPDGAIRAEFDVMPAVLAELGRLLWEHSPVLTGRYQRSHRLLADGLEIASLAPPFAPPALPEGAREFAIVPTVIYARLLEPNDGRRAISKKAPDGVYHVVAELMAPALSHLALISFDYREVAGLEESEPERAARPGAQRDLRQPALIVRPL